MPLVSQQPPMIWCGTIETGVVGYNEDDVTEQIIHSVVVDLLRGNQLIGDPGQIHDLGRDRKPRVLEPIS